MLALMSAVSIQWIIAKNVLKYAGFVQKNAGPWLRKWHNPLIMLLMKQADSLKDLPVFEFTGKYIGFQ
jgi:hypothetical protein